MAAADDTTEPLASGTLPEASDGGRPLRQRLTGTWDRLAPVAGRIVIGVAAAAVVRGVTRSSAQTEADAVEEEDTDPPTRTWRSSNAGSYYACSHQGCNKKVNPTIFSHDCCGRCGSSRNCLGVAQRDYDGPGSFAHDYFEGLMRPGVCTVCGEPPEAHRWVFDRLIGERRAR